MGDQARRAFFAKQNEGTALSGASLKNFAERVLLAKLVPFAFTARFASSPFRTEILNKKRVKREIDLD